MVTSKTHERIDEHLEADQGAGRRTHLGASVIGDVCARKIWYIFRWAKLSRHKARLLRLFDRGNREEERFVLWLRRSGIHTLDTDPETGKQFRVSDHGGHFGGSLDALIFDSPDAPWEWVLGEFKTHNQKSFNEVVKQGVLKAKWQHYVQMQIYMHKRGLRMALYMAINKNDDDLYIEVVYYDQAVAERYLDRAGQIIYSATPPERVSEDPSWYVCKFCDARDVCHKGEPMALNCRTCKYSAPLPDGTWHCLAYNVTLDEKRQIQGCATHAPIS